MRRNLQRSTYGKNRYHTVFFVKYVYILSLDYDRGRSNADTK